MATHQPSLSHDNNQHLDENFYPFPIIDIFCRVIDNYGDIGVCWRLANNLHELIIRYQLGQLQVGEKSVIAQVCHHHSSSTFIRTPVRLWVDDLHSFAKIAPNLNPSLNQQILANIHIYQWNTGTIQQAVPTAIVIEAFATDLDDCYQVAMTGKTQYWFNLEYLSAEPWVEDFHAQPSIQKNKVPKYFFFPGFTDKTGGLLREPNLIESLTAFEQNQSAQVEFLSTYVHPEAAHALTRKERLISLFCYPQAPIEALLTSIARVGIPTTILIPHGVATNIEHILNTLSICNKHILNAIKIQRFNFIPQEQFDYLLAICDINFVRGEDSFVRAIWSGKPFIWHIYYQQEDVHLEKLNAWLSNRQHQCPEKNSLISLDSLHQLWNQSGDGLVELLTHILQPETLKLSHQYHQKYREKLLKNPTLSFSLLNF